MNKELNNQERPRALSEPNTPKIKCRKIKTISRRIRDKKDEINEYYEEEIEKQIIELKNLERILSDIDPDILYDKHGGFLYDSSDEEIELPHSPIVGRIAPAPSPKRKPALRRTRFPINFEATYDYYRAMEEI